MHWNLLFGLFVVVLVAAEAEILKDPSSGFVEPKFYSSDDFENEWETFKINYGKKYSNEDEENLRKNIFSERLEEFNAHNRRYKDGHTTYTMGINQFTDMETSELEKMNGGVILPNPSEDLRALDTFVPDPSASVPDEVDWREQGYVTPVKNQGDCESCWAFCATGTLEGQHFRKTGNLVSLSDQQLVDCSTEDNGCKRGFYRSALRYIASNGGIATEEAYAYEAVQGECRYNSSTVGATCTSYVDVFRSEAALKAAVAEIGPIAVAIDAKPSFYNYQGGVYDEPNCNNVVPNHGVLVVGYGVTTSGTEYWIAKNRKRREKSKEEEENKEKEEKKVKKKRKIKKKKRIK